MPSEKLRLKSIRRAAFSLALLFFSFAVAAFSQTGEPILVALNKADAAMAIVDPVSMTLTGKVAVGDAPHEVVLSADGRTAFVANYGAQVPGSTLSVIDLASMKETRRVDLLPLLRPHGLQEVGGKIYFTSETNRAIARYDPASNKVDWLMGTGQNASHMIVGSLDQKRFYTANIASNSVTAFEFQNAPPAPSKITHIPVGNQPEAIDLSADGKEVWVGLNAEGAIDIVDTATNKFKEKIRLGERPYRVKFTPDGKSVVATMPNTKELIVLDAASRKETKRIKLESAPLGIVFSKDGKTAFVTAVQNDLVLKVDLVTGATLARVATGGVPDGIALFGM